VKKVCVGWSEAKAANVIVVKERLFAVDDASNVPKLLDVTRDGYGSFLVEPVLFLCLLQKLHEEGVSEVHHWHHEPLLLFSLTHLYSQTPFRHSSSEPFLLPLKTLHSLLPTATHHCKKKTERRLLCLYYLSVSVLVSRKTSKENKEKAAKL